MLMRLFSILKPRKDKSIPFIILVSFLVTFITSRFIVNLFPNFFLSVKGIHVHHFAYGIVILSLTSLISITTAPKQIARYFIAAANGLGLGLAYDEFAMWIQLEDSYFDRRNFDAVSVITLIFLNIIYFDGFWKRWSRRILRVMRYAYRLPQKAYHRWHLGQK